MLNLNRKVVLGSGSPRRKELLGMRGLSFEVVRGEIDEVVDETLEPSGIVLTLANQKADELVSKVDSDSILITADTLVFCDGKILGKPKDRHDAYSMLEFLAGKKQSVLTAVVVCDKKHDKKYEIVEESYLYMKNLSGEEIDAYIETGDPMDKAGAYGVQTISAVFIERIEGDFYNIMGLPINKLYEVLRKIEN